MKKWKKPKIITITEEELNKFVFSSACSTYVPHICVFSFAR